VKYNRGYVNDSKIERYSHPNFNIPKTIRYVFIKGVRIFWIKSFSSGSNEEFSLEWGMPLKKSDASLKIYRKPKSVADSFQNEGRRATLFAGDCLELFKELPDSSVDLIVTSPPYCIGKEYEKGWDLERFKSLHEQILPEAVRVLRDGGNLCWEVGYHIKDGVNTPLDFIIYEIATRIPSLKLKNRIIWTYGHGLHSNNRFSGRHETILWFSKGDKQVFNLDPVRVPQKYPGKTHYKGPKLGQPSGNPLGKNPSDVWDHIPNVKAGHIEKTAHPCQFPVALVENLVLALSPENGIVLDPFSGVSSTGVAAIRRKRRYIGAELSKEYVAIAKKRLKAALAGTLEVREMNKPIAIPNPESKVAKAPDHFVRAEKQPTTDKHNSETVLSGPM